MSQKYTSDIIVWLTDLKESLVWSYYLAHGLVQKKEVTLSTVYVMSQKYTSDIIIWLTDLKESFVWSNYLARGLVQKKSSNPQHIICNESKRYI